MLVACWSVKGGSGTTVVSVALASVLAGSSPAGALLADLCGDVPAVLGVAEPSGPGLAEWVAAGGAVAPDSLRRLEVEGFDGVRLLPAGGVVGAGGQAGGEVLAALLAREQRPVVADCGCLGAGGGPPGGPALAVAAGATVSLLVLRACYLSVRRAASLPVRPSGVVLVTGPGRALTASDVESVLGVPVRAEVVLDPAVARAVDSGLFAARLPRGLVRSLSRAA